MARAPDSKSGCWGFESLLACQNSMDEDLGLLENVLARQEGEGRRNGVDLLRVVADGAVKRFLVTKV